MAFKKLTDWSAKRSSAKMTIDALDAAGKPIRVTGVEKIEGKAGKVTAVDINGKRYELA